MGERAAALVLLALLLPAPAAAQAPVFQDEVVAGPFEGAVGIAFDALGTLFVWERAGRVRAVEPGGAQHLLLDLGEEVGSWGDHGLLGFALDPDFDFNGRFYLSYVVDHHHLFHFGQPDYDPAANAYGIDTIGRVTRYAVYDAHDLSLGVDPTSRAVLVGATHDTGIPVCGATHGIGTLAFGEDGTLLVGAGDGTSHATSHTCVADGIIGPKENVGRFRAQLVDSHAGKLLRIDPETGLGLPSNPWYDPLAPGAPRSRVWALGLRNPFRFTVRPGSGASDPALGDPGSVYVGDVGNQGWEELDVARAGGLDFGWPVFEGHEPQPDAVGFLVPNQDAPNPLFGQPLPGGGTCATPFFSFHDLLAQETLAAPSWPNPCDPGVPVPPALVHEHTSPALAWQHAGTARVKAFDVAGALAPIALGAPGCPVAGAPFDGNCSVGGTWPPAAGLPPELHGAYFFADYGQGWIKSAAFDADDELLSVQDFAQGAGAVVALATHPELGGIWYVNLIDPEQGGESTVRRISFELDGHPVARAEPSVAWGPSPLSLALDATASEDPEGLPLAFEWDFGDGTPKSRRARPVHVFPSEDATGAAAVVSRLDELSPFASPFPTGAPAVVVDGFYPMAGLGKAFFTYHVFHGQPVKGGVDWVGLAFAEQRTLHGLEFQEGPEISGAGGWFETFDVEVRGPGGQWSPVQDLVVTPPYGGQDGAGWERHEITFAPTAGDAVRVVGAPGGAFQFVTVAELRAVAAPLAPPAGPAAWSVHLTATDAAGQTSSSQALVATDDTPPVVTILEPANGASFPNDGPSSLALSGLAVDAEHSVLACEWRVILHHENHLHPEDPLADCLGQALLLPHGLEGDSVWYEVRYTATDPLGLSASVSHWLAPDDDCNANGRSDLLDVLSGSSKDANRDGVPDECQRDCDGDGASDALEIAAGVAADADKNGVPDECQAAQLPDFKLPRRD